MLFSPRLLPLSTGGGLCSGMSFSPVAASLRAAPRLPHNTQRRCSAAVAGRAAQQTSERTAHLRCPTFLCRGRRSLAAPAVVKRRRAVSGGGDDDGDGGESEGEGEREARKQFLLQYVAEVKPELLDVFCERAPEEVVDAFRQTVAGACWTLLQISHPF